MDSSAKTKPTDMKPDYGGGSMVVRPVVNAPLTTAQSDTARLVFALEMVPRFAGPHVPAPCHPPACDTRVMLSGVVWLQLPIVIGVRAVALLAVVGLAAFRMRKSNMESGADNVQPVQVELKLDDNTRVPAPPSPNKGAGYYYGNLDDAQAMYVAPVQRLGLP